MSSAVYLLFVRWSPWIIAWLSGFILLTVVCLMRRARAGTSSVHRDSLIGGELPGLPLVLMHSVGFAASLLHGDWISVVVFGWWGPGFLLIAGLVLAKRPVPWRALALPMSWACKVNYLVLVGIFAYWRCWEPIFAYSLWIMHDQVRLSWLQGNADRTRRTSEDGWLPRICYPGFLVLPWLVESFPGRWWCAGMGTVIFLLWIWGLVRVRQQGRFFTKPVSFTDNLRDIVYLRLHGQGRQISASDAGTSR